MKRKSKPTGWTYVTSVESDNELGVSYDIKRNAATGLLGCDCMAYRFKRGEKTCKHLQAYRETDSLLAHLAHSDQPRTAPRRARVGAETFTVQRRAITFGEIQL